MVLVASSPGKGNPVLLLVRILWLALSQQIEIARLFTGFESCLTARGTCGTVGRELRSCKVASAAAYAAPFTHWFRSTPSSHGREPAKGADDAHEQYPGSPRVEVFAAHCRTVHERQYIAVPRNKPGCPKGVLNRT